MSKLTQYWRSIERRLHEESSLHYPLNKIRLILKAYVDGILNDYEKDARQFFDQGFLLTAIADYLDERGNEMGIPRNKGTVAKGTVLFTLSEPATSKITIPANTLIQSNVTTYEYITKREVSFDVDDEEVRVGVEAITDGARFNCDAGELTVIDKTYLSSKISVTNDNVIKGGSDGETDDAYRQRLFNSINTHLTINYLKKQGIIIYSKEEYDNDIRLKMSSLNPYLNNEYCAIPNSYAMRRFMYYDMVHKGVFQIYIKGW